MYVYVYMHPSCHPIRPVFTLLVFTPFLDRLILTVLIFLTELVLTELVLTVLVLTVLTFLTDVLTVLIFPFLSCI